jgi:hypothetical protein
VTVFGFDLPAFIALLELAKKHGNGLQVLAFLNSYGNKTQLENEINKLQGEYRILEEEVELKRQNNLALQVVNENLQQRIGSIEERYRNSLLLQSIAKLLDNPVTAELNTSEFMTLAQKLLVAQADYGYIHRESLGNWNLYIQPKLTQISEALGNIMAGKM